MRMVRVHPEDDSWPPTAAGKKAAALMSVHEHGTASEQLAQLEATYAAFCVWAREPGYDGPARSAAGPAMFSKIRDLREQLGLPPPKRPWVRDE